MPWSPERRAAAHSHFAQAADAEGLPHAQRSRWYNSVPAHQAAEWAAEQGQGEDFRRAVFRAYFADLQNIGSPDVLAGLAEGLKLDGADLRAALAEGRYRDRVQGQFETARQLGITGVPAYVAGRYLMVGAQPLEVFRQLVETAQAEETGPDDQS